MKTGNMIAGVLFIVLDVFILSYPLTGTENLPCTSMLLIIIGLLFMLFQTGAAAGATGWKSSLNPALISREIVVEDSKTRWRIKSPDEVRLGLVFLIAGILSLPITILISLLFHV